MTEVMTRISQHHNGEGKLVTSVSDVETGELLYSVEMDSSKYRTVNQTIADIAYEDAFSFILGSGYQLKGEVKNEF